MPEQTSWQGFMQYGALGVTTGVLLGLLIWIVKFVMTSLAQTIRENTIVVGQLRDALLSRDLISGDHSQRRG